MNEQLYLVYINPLGTTYKNEQMAEFLFSNKLVKGEDWETEPVNLSNIEPPEPSKIKCSQIFKTNEVELIYLQETEKAHFCYNDAVDGIIAIAWEELNEYEEMNLTRLVFYYGESYENVNDKLYARNLRFNDNVS